MFYALKDFSLCKEAKRRVVSIKDKFRYALGIATPEDDLGKVMADYLVDAMHRKSFTSCIFRKPKYEPGTLRYSIFYGDYSPFRYARRLQREVEYWKSRNVTSLEHNSFRHWWYYNELALSLMTTATARRALCDYMELLSEHLFSAGWLQSLEHTLWECLTSNEQTTLEPHQVETLRNLSSIALGWFVYGDNGPEFVPLDIWVGKHRTWQEELTHNVY